MVLLSHPSMTWRYPFDPENCHLFDGEIPHGGNSFTFFDGEIHDFGRWSFPTFRREEPVSQLPGELRDTVLQGMSSMGHWDFSMGFLQETEGIQGEMDDTRIKLYRRSPISRQTYLMVYFQSTSLLWLFWVLNWKQGRLPNRTFLRFGIDFGRQRHFPHVGFRHFFFNHQNRGILNIDQHIHHSIPRLGLLVIMSDGRPDAREWIVQSKHLGVATLEIREGPEFGTGYLLEFSGWWNFGAAYVFCRRYWGDWNDGW